MASKYTIETPKGAIIILEAADNNAYMEVTINNGDEASITLDRDDLDVIYDILDSFFKREYVWPVSWTGAFSTSGEEK